MKKRQVKCDYTNLVVAVPHSSGNIPYWQWDDDGRNAAKRRWTDWFTDELFGVDAPNITVVKADISRFDCDVERLEGEEERLARFVHEDESRFRDFVARNATRLNGILAYWFRYRADILTAAGEGRPLIIDAHSFPSDLAPDVDICLGFNDDLSMPYEYAIDEVKRIFEEAGYSVALNRPYANAIAPEGYIGHSLMIEVNKRLYMNEKTIEKSDGFGRLQSVIRQVYEELLWTPRHEPRYFHNPYRASGENWEQMKRGMVHYVAERFGLAEPEDLSQLGMFRTSGGPSWQLSADWVRVANAMLTNAFARVGEEVPEDGLVQHCMARRSSTAEWMNRYRKSF